MTRVTGFVSNPHPCSFSWKF